MPIHHPNIIRSPLKAIALAGMLALSLCPATTALADGIANAGPAGQPGVIDIVTHTPSWVWPLILFGLFIGWTRTRDRVVAPSRLFVMPALIGGLALHNLALSGASAGGLLGFVCGAVAGALAGTAAPRPAARRRTARGARRLGAARPGHGDHRHALRQGRRDRPASGAGAGRNLHAGRHHPVGLHRRHDGGAHDRHTPGRLPRRPAPVWLSLGPTDRAMTVRRRES